MNSNLKGIYNYLDVTPDNMVSNNSNNDTLKLKISITSELIEFSFQGKLQIGPEMVLAYFVFHFKNTKILPITYPKEYHTQRFMDNTC